MTMQVSDDAVLLAGLALAHAAWSLSGAPEGELLCPLAFVQEGEAFKLIRFEADSQEVAIREAKSFLNGEGMTKDGWAFAREGLMRESNGPSVDVISVDAWAQGMEKPFVLVQQFRPAAAGRFAIVGAPALAIDGVEQHRDGVRALVERLQDGIRGHPSAGALWDGWRSD
jgi:hypothetical protein